MKKRLMVLSILLFGVLFVFNTSCEEDPKEACDQEEFCEGEPEVTLCCTDGEECYWTYDGNEYADTDSGLDDLFNDLGCTSTTKSANNEQIREDIYNRLFAMRERVIAKSLL